MKDDCRYYWALLSLFCRFLTTNLYQSATASTPPDSINLAQGCGVICCILRSAFSVDYRHDGGTFNLAVFNINVNSAVELGRDPAGRLSVSTVSCDAQVGDVDMQFHGGARYRTIEGGEAADM